MKPSRVVLLVVLTIVAASATAQTTTPPPAPPAAKSPPQPTKKTPAIAPNQTRRFFLPPDPRDEAAILAEDAQIPREQQPTGPVVEVSLFGSPPAKGRSFVFVIDRSNSMGSAGLGAISAAADELSSHLSNLTPENTFQVVAYNEATAYFSGRQLVPATDETKRRLVKYIAEITAGGQTEHTRGLLAALRLRPEVIFLLTDGGDPKMSRGDLNFVQELAGSRTKINCLHFGRGPKPEEPSFLAKLASDNRGSYAYIDVTRLETKPR
jgi:hypothetical protein